MQESIPILSVLTCPWMKWGQVWTYHIFKFKDWPFITSHLQFHVSHGGTDGVNGIAIIQARVGLSQVVNHQTSLPLFVFDFITTQPCVWYNLLLKQYMIHKHQILQGWGCVFFQVCLFLTVRKMNETVRIFSELGSNSTKTFNLQFRT